MGLRKTILCIDDEPLILMLLKKQLSLYFGNRIQVESAQNAPDALSLLEDCRQEGNPVCLILSDWLMPGMKGDEFLLQVYEKYPEIPSLMISGQVDEEALETVKARCPLKGFFHKPWDVDELIQAVEACLKD